jgi:hypothetical protein
MQCGKTVSCRIASPNASRWSHSRNYLPPFPLPFFFFPLGTVPSAMARARSNSIAQYLERLI